MDSKTKFIKNRYWKRKYHPRNATSTTSVKKPLEQKNEKSSYQAEEESEDEFELKQPIPKEGWFPDYDSSSSSDIESFESLTNFSSSVSTLSSKKGFASDKNCDENWFDKELDNVQLTSDVPAIERYKNLKENENKLKSTFQDTAKNEKYQAADSKTSNVRQSVEKKESTNAVDNEEEELEFLLSLKEPVHTGPVIVKKNFDNERRLAVSNNSSTEHKPIKSIDLEKWLDSVLDD